MTTTIQGLPGDQLTWLIGIEDTCVYPDADATMGPLNEFALTGHDDHWREDLDAVADLGASGLRYGVSWPLVHLAPGVFDWSRLDERIHYAVHGLGLTIIADLVHYGTPTWLEGSFASPDYPEAVADFAREFAARYRGVVDHITPLNEPLTTASFCGLRGVWPPALTGWEGWATVAVGIARGVQRSISEIRVVNPDAVIVHVEASGIYRTAEDRLAVEVALLQSLSTLPTDLILGRVDGSHPLRSWLQGHGIPTDRLDELETHATDVDVMGVNYYPDLTPRVLETVDGVVRQVTANHWSAGLKTVLTGWSKRYGKPILVTETSIEGTEAVRKDWLEAAVGTVRELHDEGVDIRGLTWWPLLDFVDWSFASGGRNVEEFVLDPSRSADATQETFADPDHGLTPFFRRMGLFELVEDPDGTIRRVPTAAASAFPELTRAAGAETTGDRA